MVLELAALELAVLVVVVLLVVVVVLVVLLAVVLAPPVPEVVLPVLLAVVDVAAPRCPIRRSRRSRWWTSPCRRCPRFPRTRPSSPPRRRCR